MKPLRNSPSSLKCAGQAPLRPTAKFQQHQCSVMQPKGTRALHPKSSPQAPPVYRPQPLQKVLQTKKATLSNALAALRRHIAPAGHGLQPPSRTVQAKKAHSIVHPITVHRGCIQRMQGPPAPPAQPAPPPEVSPEYHLGAGDFSEQVALFRAGQLPQHSVVTAYDSEQTVLGKYETARENIAFLRAHGIDVRFGVNATDLRSTSSPRRTRRTVFTFPHTGDTVGNSSAEREYSIGENQELLEGFFRESWHKLKYRSDFVKITLKTSEPYSSWNVEEIAKREGFELIQTVPFHSVEGYVHRQTVSGKQVSHENAKTYWFRPYQRLWKP